MRLTFEEPESGVTIVKLTHTDVPEEDRFVALATPHILVDSKICDSLYYCDNAGMAMQLWSKIRRGGGEILSSTKYGQFLVSEYEIFRLGSHSLVQLSWFLLTIRMLDIN